MITIKAREIVVETASATAYIEDLNGSSLECHEYTLSLVNGTGEAVVNGQKIEVTFYNKLSRLGKIGNKATVEIYNGLGKSETKNYSIKVVQGTLSVTSKQK